MRRKFVHVVVAAAVLALAGAAQAAPPADPQVAQALPYMDRANSDWLPALKAADAERLAEAYAADAEFVTGDGTVIKGHDAIRDLYKARAARGATVLSGEIQRDGATLAKPGLVFEWGHGGSTTREADGTTRTSGGPYLTVWRREADGGWKIIRNLVF